MRALVLAASGFIIGGLTLTAVAVGVLLSEAKRRPVGPCPLCRSPLVDRLDDEWICTSCGGAGLVAELVGLPHA